MNRHSLPGFFQFLTVLLLACCLLSAVAPSYSVRAESNERGYDVKETVLTGKKILFTGGSITEAYCERENKRRDISYGWASRIGEYNQMTWITTARGGASISNCRGDNTILNQLKSKQNYSYDIILLQGGTNDAWDSVPVGTLTSGFASADSYDLSTFAGGLEATISFAKEHFPDAWIAYNITFRLPLATQGRMSDMSEYVSLIQEACDKWGVPYLDMYHDDDLNDLLEVGTSTRYLSDHIHPNSPAYELLYPVVETWLITAYGEYLNPADPVSASDPEPVSEPTSESRPDPSSDEPARTEPTDISAAVAAVSAAVLLGSLATFLIILFRRKKKR